MDLNFKLPGKRIIVPASFCEEIFDRKPAMSKKCWLIEFFKT